MIISPNVKKKNKKNHILIWDMVLFIRYTTVQSVIDRGATRLVVVKVL